MTLSKAPHFLIQCLLTFATIFISTSLQAQERWFQVEVSIFSNEGITDRTQEEWQANRIKLSYPKNLRRLNSVADFFLPDSTVENNQVLIDDLPRGALEREALNSVIEKTRPKRKNNERRFKLINLAREPYFQLPAVESDFQQTNQTLQRSPDHRLLFHGNWRQVVTQKSETSPILIEGGLAYGNQHELQGSLTVRFNQNEDRVVLDANLWLTEFSIVQNTEENWSLPLIPEDLQNKQSVLESTLSYFPNNVYHMNQTRDMRSMEFHYLDHPGLGLVVLVKPINLSEL